jgi:hypothetical protein
MALKEIALISLDLMLEKETTFAQLIVKYRLKKK